MIAFLENRLAEIGRIKIGGLGAEKTSSTGKTFRSPVKYQHFTVTGMCRGKDGNFERDAEIHQIVGETPKELDIVLLYNEIPLNFTTSLAYYQGKACICRGDGQQAERLDQKTGELITCACPCDMYNKPGGCKAHGILRCILKDAQMAGGVWVFKTTSFNSIRNIQSSLVFLAQVTGGKIAGIPLKMRLYEKDTVTPDGKPTKIYVVGLFFQGNTMALVENAIAMERKRLEAGIRMEQLEQTMRAELLRLPEPEMLDPEEVEEFHPDAEPEKKGRTLADAIAAATVAEPVAKSVVEPVAEEQAVEQPIEEEAPAQVEEPPAEPPKPKLRFYACFGCGKPQTVEFQLIQCKCGSKDLKECAGLKEANQALAERKPAAPAAQPKAPAVAVKTAAPPAAPQKPVQAPLAPAPIPASQKPDPALVEDVLGLCSQYNIIDQVFHAYVAKSIGRPERNLEAMTNEELQKVSAHIRRMKGATAPATASAKSDHPAISWARDLFRGLGRERGPVVIERLARLHGATAPLSVSPDRLDLFGRDVQGLAKDMGRAEEMLSIWESERNGGQA